MGLTDLPIPAFQCVVEHMVATVGLYKAVRLRLISCKFPLKLLLSSPSTSLSISDLVTGRFNEEVDRAVFQTRIFDFNGDWRPRMMRPEVMARRLIGEVTRPTQLADPLTITIKTLAEWLERHVEGTEAGDGKTARDFISTLCHAAAHHIPRYDVCELLKTPLQPKPFPADPSPIDQLAAAAAVGSLQQVRNLLAEGIEPNAESEYLGYPVQNAAFNNHADLVTIFLQQPSKETSCSDPSNHDQANARAAALIAASGAGHNNIVQYILSSTTNLGPDLPQEHNAAAIEAAATNGHIDALRSLILAQARSPFPDSTSANQAKIKAFFTACFCGYLQVVHMLVLEFGVDAKVTNHEGRNGLHMAAEGGHARVVSLLLKHGTRFYAYNRGDPVFLAAKNGHEYAVRVLLDAGADVDPDGGCDAGILSGCARNEEVSMIRYLMTRGLIVKAGGWTAEEALERAADRGQVESVKLLAALGAPVSGRKRKNGPLLRALLYGQDEVVKVLREFGAEDAELRGSEYLCNIDLDELPLRYNP